MIPSPLFHYPLSSADPSTLDCVRGDLRRIRHRGRAGVLLTEVFGGIILGPHHLDAPRGTISLWVMAMEDLHSAARCDNQDLNMSEANEFTLFNDRPTVKDSRASLCSLTWTSFWTPSLYLKRRQGHIYDCFTKTPRHACACAGHFAFQAKHWYQIAYAWDTAAGRHRIYANGVLVASNDSSGDNNLLCPKPGPQLCVGSTMFATGDITGYTEELNSAVLTEIYHAETCDRDPSLMAELARTYHAEGLGNLSGDESATWREELSLSLQEPSQLAQFMVQGCVEAAQIDNEGLRITTTAKDPAHDFSIIDLNHVYLWSRQSFDGDHLHLSYDFCNLKPGGLSLLMMQVSGMQREDILTNHRQRSNGIMKTVCWEDVRNYHWEYLREMDDVRNDVASHAMLKNPWQQALGFGIHGPRYEIGSWHRLDWLQEGPRIRCAIDGAVVIDALDRPDQNHGPVLSGGRFAIRCMTRTDVRLRNLTVRVGPFLDG